MSVCMYAFMYVSIYVGTYVCIYVCKRVYECIYCIHSMYVRIMIGGFGVAESIIYTMHA
jgi:hypothetical protein